MKPLVIILNSPDPVSSPRKRSKRWRERIQCPEKVAAYTVEKAAQGIALASQAVVKQ